MKKTFLTGTMIVLMLGILTGCGPKSIEEVEGKEYECKQFSALCPEGWSNYPVKDLNDENAISNNHLRFYKGETEDGTEPAAGAIYSNAYIDIGHYQINAKLYDESMGMYSDVQEVELDVQGTKWKGHSGMLAGYNDANIWKDGSTEWQVTIRLTDEDGDLELDDMDIQAILASIKLK